MNKTDKNGFDDMAAFARSRLKGRSLEGIAKRSGGCFDEEENLFRIKSLGKEICLSLPGFECESPETDLWQYLVLLHYLDLADGAAFPGQWMSFGEMKDGLVRGTKFDKSSSTELSGIFENKDEAQIEQMLSGLCAEAAQSKADIGAVISFLPNFPFFINIWLADEEFPVSAKLLVPKNADHYLTIEDAVTAGEVVIGALRRQL